MSNIYNKRILLFLLAYVSFAAYLVGQAVAHYRIKIQDTESVPTYSLEACDYSEDYKDVSFRSIIPPTSDHNIFRNGLSEILEAHDAGLLLYIHGFGADIDIYQAHFSTEFYTHFLNKQDGGCVDLMISFIWENKPYYPSTKRQMEQKAEAIQPMYNHILENDTHPKMMLAHSMGNRLALRLMRGYGKHDQIQRLVMASPDVEPDHPALAGVHLYAEETSIYIHNNDRILGFARALDGLDRLGLNGWQRDSLPCNIRLVDASMITDASGLSNSISNHRYFYTSPTVRSDISSFMGWTKSSIGNKKGLCRNGIDHVLLLNEAP